MDVGNLVRHTKELLASSTTSTTSTNNSTFAQLLSQAVKSCYEHNLVPQIEEGSAVTMFSRFNPSGPGKVVQDPALYAEAQKSNLALDLLQSYIIGSCRTAGK